MKGRTLRALLAIRDRNWVRVTGLRHKLRLPMLVAGTTASLLGSACSSATVSAPEATPIAVSPATPPSAAEPSTSQDPGTPAKSERAAGEPHPYAFLWKAAAAGANPFERHTASAAPSTSPGEVVPPTDGTTASGQQEQQDAVAQETPLANPPEGHTPDVSGEEAEANAALDGKVWRPTDLAGIAPYLQGIASWYGPNFHGKLTANGETYNQYGLTAAHPVLPIGTRILVENLNNGHRVWLRVNDRGPYAKGRVLDLSRMAAERLGMIEQGTAPVRITVLKWPDTVQASFGLKPFQQYTAQAAAYPDLDTAEELRERLQAQFPELPFFVEPASNGFFAVAAGPFDNEREAKLVSRKIHRSGMSPMVRRYRN